MRNLSFLLLSAVPFLGASPARSAPQDGQAHTYVQRFDERGERYLDDRDASRDMEAAAAKIRAAGYVILHKFVTKDGSAAGREAYRFEISYIAPRGANVNPAAIESLGRLKDDDCQVINPEFCR